MFGSTRIRLNLQTRNPEDRPTVLPLVRHIDGQLDQREIPASEFPLVIPGLRLPPPGILTGQPKHSDNVGEFWCKYVTADLQPHLEGGKETAVRLAQFNNLLFCRMLAKIAHSFAVAEFGFHSFRPYLRELILGGSDVAFHYVGGDMTVSPEDPAGLHKIFARREVIMGTDYVIVYLTLFTPVGAPEYRIVVGSWNGGR